MSPVTNGGVVTAVASSNPIPMRKSLTPAAPAAAGVLAATTLPAAGTTTISSGFTQPDVPRNLSITGNQAGIVGTVTINGTNEDGAAISENIVGAGAATVVGNKAFKTVTSVVFPTRNTAGDTVSIGTGSKLGLGTKLARNTVINAFLNKVKEGTAPTIAFSATAVESNTALLNSAIPGGQSVDIDFTK
jgi:hypothetical protein